MTQKQKKRLLRILLSAVLLAAVRLLSLPWPAYLVPYALIGWDVLRRAVQNVCGGQIFDEHFLMSVATVGALFCGEYTEAVTVMLFYQVGELFQNVAVARSRRSIAALMDIRPDSAHVERDGVLVDTDPEEVLPGEVIVVKPGERVPLDGIVLEGISVLDTASLTGESLPRDVSPGREAISGCVNLTGLLRVQVSKPYTESTVARILELVENAGEKKARAEHFITRFARYYTPAVVFSALALALLPPLLGFGPISAWVRRALIFLVVSCPCALVISIPLTFFGGIGGASRQGILVKGGNYLESLARVGIMVFDKTGTLTEGRFRIAKLCPIGVTEGELLSLAALAEQFSDHPIARSVCAAAPTPPIHSHTDRFEELAGLGIRAHVNGRSLLAGNSALMAAAGLSCPHTDATAVHVAADGVYVGYIQIADRPKAGSPQALAALRACGVRKTVMLTGDTTAAAQAVARELGLDEVHASLLPADKVSCLEQLLAGKAPGEQLVFVGDGINDAPVLTRADIGIAMGAMGSDAAIEAADIVLMDDDLSKLSLAVTLARKTLRIVRQNIVFALGVKFLVLALSAFGRANMWMAVFADVGVSVIAILNAGRMLRPKP